MSSITPALRPAPLPRRDALRGDPATQAYLLLRVVFIAAPVLFGIDKFAGVLVDDWAKYLAPEFNDLLPGSAADAMHAVGIVEIAAGIVVAVIPRFGGLVVAGGWAASSSACCSWAATATSSCATSACSWAHSRFRASLCGASTEHITRRGAGP